MGVKHPEYHAGFCKMKEFCFDRDVLKELAYR